MSFQRAHKLEPLRKTFSIEEWYSCVRKQRLNQKAAGLRAAKFNAEKNNPSFAYSAYQCKFCQQWHVGRHYKKRKRGDLA